LFASRKAGDASPIDHWTSHDLRRTTRTGLARLGCPFEIGESILGHPNAKPWKGEGPGILEIVEDHRGDTYRAVYAVRFAEVVYVLHAFQKKSKRGIKTPQTDVKLIAERLKRAQADYESRGKP